MERSELLQAVHPRQDADHLGRGAEVAERDGWLPGSGHALPYPITGAPAAGAFALTVPSGPFQPVIEARRSFFKSPVRERPQDTGDRRMVLKAKAVRPRSRLLWKVVIELRVGNDRLVVGSATEVSWQGCPLASLFKAIR